MGQQPTKMSDNRQWGNNQQEINKAGFREAGVGKGTQASRDQRGEEVGMKQGGAFAKHQHAGAKQNFNQTKK